MTEVETETCECYGAHLFVSVDCKLRKDPPVSAKDTIHGSHVPAVDGLMLIMPRGPALVVTKFLVCTSNDTLAALDTTTIGLCLHHKNKSKSKNRQKNAALHFIRKTVQPIRMV